MEVAGSKAQAGAGIQALLQTDPNTSKLQGAITDNGKDRQRAWPAMAGDWESTVRAGPGRPWLPGKPSTSVCSWTKELGWGWGPGARSGLCPAPHIILGAQPWALGAQPSTQHQARPGRWLVADVALRGQPQPSGHPRPHPACPAPGLQQHPSKDADRCRTPGTPAVPPAQYKIQGPATN